MGGEEEKGRCGCGLVVLQQIWLLCWFACYIVCDESFPYCPTFRLQDRRSVRKCVILEVRVNVMLCYVFVWTDRREMYNFNTLLVSMKGK